MYCKNCGETVDENAIVCVKCGSKKGYGTAFCAHCGAQVKEGQIACMTCGYALPNQEVEAKKPKKSKKKPIVIIVSVILIAAIVIVAIVANQPPEISFSNLYDQYCLSTWAEVGDDGSYLCIDTNPYDIDDDFFFQAYEAIELVNRALGLPDSLFLEMGQTTLLDGKQVKNYKDLGVKVSWTYSSDCGLEVIYSKIE